MKGRKSTPGIRFWHNRGNHGRSSSRRGGGQVLRPQPAMCRPECGVLQLEDEQTMNVGKTAIPLNSETMIGKGEHGIVYRVSFPDPKGTINMAVKCIHDTNINDHREDLLRDLELNQIIKHKSFVAYYGFDYREASLWLFFELMVVSWDKIYLEAKKQEIFIPADVLRCVACSLGSALNHLQENSILHRDIKPSNILLGFGGEVKLCDLGLARQYAKDAPAQTFVGCAAYMSPERLQMKQYNLKSEIWSIGMSLLELANRRHPIETRNSFICVVEAITEASLTLFADKFDRSIDHDIYDEDLNDLIGLYYFSLSNQPEDRLDEKSFNDHPFLKGTTQNAYEWWTSLTQSHESTSSSTPSHIIDDEDAAL